jgi:hypothetical protein
VNEVTTRSLIVACVFNDGQVVWSVDVLVDTSVPTVFIVLSLVVRQMVGTGCILLYHQC